MGSAIIVLATTADDKVSLVAGVTKDLTDRVKAGELIGNVAQQVGGKGGGRPDQAFASNHYIYPQMDGANGSGVRRPSPVAIQPPSRAHVETLGDSYVTAI